MLRTRLVSSFALALLLVGLSLPPAARAADVTIDSATMTLGYMNVFNLPADGGAFQFGSGWGIADLNATFPSASTVNFTPNTIGDPNPYWYIPSGGPGATGNKIMEANLYAQPAAGLLNGQTINFSGIVDSFTLVEGYAFKAFVRDFAPDFSSVVETIVPITGPGAFTASLATINDPARNVQWGLQMTGPNVWATDVAAKGSVAVSAVPEPGILGLAAAGLAGLAGLRRSRR